jgi:aspartyl protease family protein
MTDLRERPDRNPKPGGNPPQPSESDGSDTPRKVGRLMAFAAWLIVLGFITLLAQELIDDRGPQSGTSADGSATLLLRADRRGHFVVDTRVNGESVTFLVDTGATGIALPARAAERLELERGRPIQVSTAAGLATAWTTRLDSFQVGPFAQTNVAATISPDMEGEIGLLGMSFLRHFEMVQRDGQLLIRQP